MTEDTGITAETTSGDGAAQQEPLATNGTARTPGQLLRATRMARGLSIEEVARTIKFTPRQIEALERDDYVSLPGATVVRGFMRSYAKFLQLDATSVLAGYESQMPKLAASMGEVSDIGASLPTPGKGGFAGGGRLKLILAALALLLAALAYFYWPLAGVDFPLRSEMSQVVPTSSMPSQQASIVSPSADSHTGAQSAAPTGQAGKELGVASVHTPAMSAPVEGGMPVAAGNTLPQGGAQPAAGTGVVNPQLTAATTAVGTTPANTNPTSQALPSKLLPSAELPQLMFVFADRAWVEVKDATGRVLLAQNSMPQTQQRVSGKPPFDIVIGNASRVKLLYEDQPVDLQPYTKVDVARLRLE